MNKNVEELIDMYKGHTDFQLDGKVDRGSAGETTAMVRYARIREEDFEIILDREYSVAHADIRFLAEESSGKLNWLPDDPASAFYFNKGTVKDFATVIFNESVPDLAELTKTFIVLDDRFRSWEPDSDLTEKLAKDGIEGHFEREGYGPKDLIRECRRLVDTYKKPKSMIGFVDDTQQKAAFYVAANLQPKDIAQDDEGNIVFKGIYNGERNIDVVLEPSFDHAKTGNWYIRLPSEQSLTTFDPIDVCLTKAAADYNEKEGLGSYRHDETTEEIGRVKFYFTTESGSFRDTDFDEFQGEGFRLAKAMENLNKNPRTDNLRKKTIIESLKYCF